MGYFNFRLKRKDPLVINGVKRKGFLEILGVKLISEISNDPFLRVYVDAINLSIEGAKQEIEVFSNMPWSVKEGMTVKWASGPGSISFVKKNPSTNRYLLSVASVPNDELDRTENVTLETTSGTTLSHALTITQPGMREIIEDAAGNLLETPDGLILIALK